MPEAPAPAPARSADLWVLGALAALLVAIGFPYLDDPLVYPDDWGHAQFLLYAENYQRMGLETTRLLPVFGKVGGQLLAYTNHPWLSSLLLGAWRGLIPDGVLAYRTLALLFSLLSAGAIYALGRELRDSRTGLLAAALYAFFPLSLRLSATWCMELPFYTFLLGSLALGARWERTGERRTLAAAAGLLALAQATDHYALFLVPGLLGLAAARPRLRGGFLLLASVPVAVEGAYLAALFGMGALGSTWETGGARYTDLTGYWTSPGYWGLVFQRSVRLFGGLALLAALVGLADRGPASRTWLGLLGLLAGSYVLAAGGAITHHEFLLLFLGGPVALLAGLGLGGLPRAPRLALAALALALAIPAGTGYFQATHAGDLQTAELIREHTRDSDMLVGLPPHMARTVGRPMMVAYYHFWAGGPTAPEPGFFRRRLLPLVEEGRPRRVILFTQFMVRPDVAPPAWDFSRALALPGYRLRSGPGKDPLIWVREGGS